MSRNQSSSDEAKSEMNPIAIINDFARMHKDDQDYIASIEKRNNLLYVITGGLLIAILASLSLLFMSDDAYFSVDEEGVVHQLKAHSTPVVDRIKRAQHAELIVRSLNSLDFVNRDVILSQMRPFFVGATFDDYELKQNSSGAFKLMDEHNMKYIPSIDPPRLIANKDSGITPAQKECYRTKTLPNGQKKQVSCNTNNLDYEGSFETYEFGVLRDVYSNAKKIDTQRFKVRITLEKSPEEWDGYKVSHYKEKV